MFFVYVLRLNNGNLYKGVTSDLRRRFHEHEQGKVRSTNQHKPLTLIHYEAYLLQSDALRRERFLKTTEGRRLLQQQLRDVIAMKKNSL